MIEVSCLDICPKAGVVVVDTRHPGEWRIIDPQGDFDEQVSALR